MNGQIPDTATPTNKVLALHKDGPRESRFIKIAEAYVRPDHIIAVTPAGRPSPLTAPGQPPQIIPDHGKCMVFVNGGMQIPLDMPFAAALAQIEKLLALP